MEQSNTRKQSRTISFNGLISSEKYFHSTYLERQNESEMMVAMTKTSSMIPKYMCGLIFLIISKRKEK